MKTFKLISCGLVSCVLFVLLVLCSCGGGGGDETIVKCGDGVVDAELGETCDDGNTDDGDDCPSDCILVSVSDDICGDGIQGTTEECDDGLTDAVPLDDGDGCSSVCKLEYCGDYVVQAGLGEQCDEGSAGSATCSNMCQTITAESEPETNCSDGVDNDGDGAVDCDDSDCVADAACVIVDTDGDGVADENDPDQDGDGLCDNENVCTVIDDTKEKNLWFYVTSTDLAFRPSDSAPYDVFYCYFCATGVDHETLPLLHYDFKAATSTSTTSSITVDGVIDTSLSIGSYNGCGFTPRVGQPKHVDELGICIVDPSLDTLTVVPISR